MKSQFFVVLMAVLLAGGVCSAQSQTSVIEDFKPSTLNQPGKEYPMVN